MLRKVSILMVIVLVFSTCQLQGTVINSSWVGDEGLWGNANNWAPNIVPDNDGNTFAVTIDAGLGEAEVGLQQSRTIDQLDCYGEVELASWADWVELTFLDANGLTNHGDLEIYELDIVGNITNYGDFDVEDSEISGSFTNKSGAYAYLSDSYIEDGNLYNETGAKLEIECDAELEGGDFTNNGWVFGIPASILWVGDGSFTNNGLINIKDSEIGNDEENGIAENFVNTSSGRIWGSGILFTAADLINSGSIVASAGNLTVFAHHHGKEIINNGTLENNVGSSLHLEVGVNDVNNNGFIIVNANGSITVKFEPLYTEPNDCTLNNEPNGVIKLFGGILSAATVVQKAGATFEGFGGITGDIIIDPNGLIELTGPTNIIGDVNIPAGATLRISDGQTLITGHTTCDGTIHLIGGTVIFQSGCDCEDCNIVNEAGLDRNHFDINVDGIVNLRDFAGFTNTWLWQATWY